MTSDSTGREALDVTLEAEANGIEAMDWPGELPARVLALIAEVRRLREERDALAAHVGQTTGVEPAAVVAHYRGLGGPPAYVPETVETEVERLRARVAELEKERQPLLDAYVLQEIRAGRVTRG